MNRKRREDESYEDYKATLKHHEKMLKLYLKYGRPFFIPTDDYDTYVCTSNHPNRNKHERDMWEKLSA